MNPYVPDALPLAGLDYRRLLPLVGQANAALARYDGLLQGIPNPALMLSPLTTQFHWHFGIHEKTTLGLLRQMKDAKILRELQASSGRRPATLCTPQLINVAEGRDVL